MLRSRAPRRRRRARRLSRCGALPCDGKRPRAPARCRFAACTSDNGACSRLPRRRTPRCNSRKNTCSTWSTSIRRGPPIVDRRLGPRASRLWRAILAYRVRRARLSALWRLLPHWNGRPHPDPRRGPRTLAKDGAQRHCRGGAARSLRHGGIRNARRRLVRAPRNAKQSERMQHLRDPGHELPRLRAGKRAMPGVSQGRRVGTKPLSAEWRV